MYSLVIKGCCNGCSEIDLNLDSYWFGAAKLYALRCRHEAVCFKLRDEALALNLSEEDLARIPGEDTGG